MLEDYLNHVREREEENVPPLALTAKQTAELVELIKNPDEKQKDFLINLLENCIPPGVDEAAYVKASFLTEVANSKITSPILSAQKATFLLGTMLGGYNVDSLIELLDNKDELIANEATKALSSTLLVYNSFNEIYEKSKTNPRAKEIVNAWAEAKWFTNKPKVPEKITLTVFKADGETNTDDLSPALHAWSRPDIPLHAKEMLRAKMPNVEELITELKAKGNPLVFVGDVVGTGSSRKSAMNSIMWHFGDDIPFVPNKRTGSYILGGKIAPIFFNTAEDSGAYPIECDVSNMNMGDTINIFPYKNIIEDEKGNVISKFKTEPVTILDEVRAGGRVLLIIGRGLTDKTRELEGKQVTDLFVRPAADTSKSNGFTLAQKMVGKACGLPGIKPGTYCEPRMSTVGSQDTTGSMTRDELKELACLGFNADFVLQSFCHTAAYPKPIDIKLQHELPDFVTSRGGVALRPGDGIIHSWLNRMLLPDKVGTGGDSHTRFPLGISFPAGSGLVAFAATLGVMPLNMPESVLVRFSGKMQPGITLRDLVNAIPYKAEQLGLLTIEKKGKKNIFSGRILEIQGLKDLKIEQAFELSDASAERSANGCTIDLNPDSIKEYIKSNITLINWMIKNNYSCNQTLNRRREAMEAWIENPTLLKADKNAEYAAVIDIDLNEIKEPLIAVPNDPDHIKPLSEIANSKIDEVFIGSCMTNIGHYRVASKLLDKMSAIKSKLWIAPPTKMDERQLIEEGHYSVFGKIGARTELPGCSLCMGNQARVADGAHVFSTSTRNFPNRLGKDAQVYLGSAELATVCAALGKLPSFEEYIAFMNDVETMAGDIYRYLQFDQMPDYIVEKSDILEKIAVLETQRL